MQVHPESVAAVFLGPLAARAGHLGEEPGRHDAPAVERAPERGEVGGGRGDAAVAGAEHGQVERVRSQAGGVQVGDRMVAREFVGAPEAGVGEACRFGHAPPHEVVVVDPAGSFGDEREHDVTGVVVGEPLVGARDRREAVEHLDVPLGRVEPVRGHGQRIGVDVVELVLSEVVADP
jgi:hypothetical protein